MNIIYLLLITISFNLFGNDPQSTIDEVKQKIVKKLEKKGFKVKEIDSYKAKTKFLLAYTSFLNNRNYHTPLTPRQISRILNCSQRNGCKVYGISIRAKKDNAKIKYTVFVLLKADQSFVLIRHINNKFN